MHVFRHVDIKTVLLLTFGFLLMQIACGVAQNDVAMYDKLTLRFQANRSRAQVGESVHMEFSITNDDSRPFVIESQDTPVMDIIVQVVGGGVLLTWSSLNPDKVSHRLEWQPGESKVIELTWTPKQGDVYFGAYRNIFLTGVLSENAKIVQSAGVTVCASDVCR